MEIKGIREKTCAYRIQLFASSQIEQRIQTNVYIILIQSRQRHITQPRFVGDIFLLEPVHFLNSETFATIEKASRKKPRGQADEKQQHQRSCMILRSRKLFPIAMSDSTTLPKIHGGDCFFVE